MANMLPSAFANDLTYWVRSNLYVSYSAPGLQTVQVGEIHRIMPSDEVRVKVWVAPVQPGSQTISDTPGVMTVYDSFGHVVAQKTGVQLTLKSTADLGKLDTPEWWDDAKFGILCVAFSSILRSSISYITFLQHTLGCI